ncbi:MAG: polysaccharide deacetylase [Ruminococcaceae bacterium]|nr:polysaccharide deacetylase [Oscillospiraceae bacterium]
MTLLYLSRFSKFLCIILALVLCLFMGACSRDVAVVEQTGLIMEVTVARQEEIEAVISDAYTTTESPTTAKFGQNCIGLTEDDLPEDAKIVYLTFDDGPSSNTQPILDILDAYGCGATFFVMNSDYKNEYKNIVDHGHAIALHTFSHDFYDLYASVDDYFADLDRISDLVYEKTGVRSMLIRFPGGSSNSISRNVCYGIMSELVDEVENRGYSYFDWNADSQDASGNNISASYIYESSTSSSANRIILLMHDTDAKDTTVDALPDIIEYYQSQGYFFLSLNENSPTAHHGVVN